MSEWWTYRLSDFLLFSPETYFRLIEQYLRDVWPARILWGIAGIGLIGALTRRRPPPTRLIIGATAAAWLWVALAFHLQRYATINWAATWFAGGFVVEAVLLCWTGVARTGLRPDRASRSGRWVGLGLVVYAVVGQPLVDRLARGSWAGAGGFGLTPDPTAIGTLGILLLAAGPRWLVFPIPLLWCLIGGATLLAMEAPDAWLILPGGLVALLLWGWTARPHGSGGEITPAARRE